MVDNRGVADGSPSSPTATISLCILCHNRPDELREALSSAAGEPWHEIIVLDMASEPPIEPVPDTTWLRSDVNAGVTAGRNQLVGEATGDLLVFLDDDAVFLTTPCQRLAAAFGADSTLGAVAFRVHRTGSDTSLEHPFRGSAHGDEDAARGCAYFVGCGYAIRRQAHLDGGGYDDRFFYSTEEVDLSFRLLRDGWRLRYEPAIEIEHRPSPRGRDASSSVPGWRMRNRLLLVRAHLPTPLAVLHAAIWGARTAVEAGRDHSLRRWWGLARDGMSMPVVRRPLGWAALAHVHRLGGRVLY